MKTSSPRNLRNCFAAALIPTILCAVLFVCTVQSSSAGSATWNLNPASGDWNTAGNRTPATVPNAPTDTATFTLSNTTDLSLSANTAVNGIVFNNGASPYTITVSTGWTLTIGGVGVTNNSGTTQNIVIAPGTSSSSTSLSFVDSATAGSATVFTTQAATASNGRQGVLRFGGTSTAGHAVIVNRGSAVNGAPGGLASFDVASTAGNATITNQGSPTAGGRFGITAFNDDATNGGDATIINDGGAVAGALGGLTHFRSYSDAGNPTLIANGGAGAGGTILFDDASTGGTARVKIFGNGNLNVADTFSLQSTIGSIEGDGIVFLGIDTLTVGSNNLSTNFSGVIQNSGSGGALIKIGSGTWRLSGANIYTAGTTINAGRFLANNTNGSAAGAGAVTVNNAAVLGGTGTITGPVSVNTGAALMGGDATTATGSLKLANNVTLNSGAIIELVLGTSGTHSILTRTGGNWTFAPNQRFTFLDVGAQSGFYDNLITGLAGDPGNVASWTITNAGFVGTFTYDGLGNIDLNLSAAAGPALQLMSAVSRKTHGAAGVFNIPLPLTGEPGVECRWSNGNYTFVFAFNNNVVSGNASVSAGAASVTGAPVFAKNTMTVNLTRVSDVQQITVTLSNVTDDIAQVLPDQTVNAGVLVGDSNGDRAVNATDIAQTKSQSGAVTNSANFRTDMNVNGTINASDIYHPKANAGHALP